MRTCCSLHAGSPACARPRRTGGPWPGGAWREQTLIPCTARAAFAATFKVWPAERYGKWIALLVFGLAIIASCSSFFALKEVRVAPSSLMQRRALPRARGLHRDARLCLCTRSAQLSGSPGTIHRRAGPGRAVRTEWRGRSGFDALGARAGCVAAAHQCCRCLAPSRRLALAPGRPGCAASEGAPARVCIQREVAAALGSRSKPWPRRLCPPLGAAGRRRRTARPASGCAWCRTCAASRCSAPSS